MAALPPRDLLSQWLHEQLPVEMAMGQVLQHIVALSSNVEAMKQAISLLQAQIDQLGNSAEPAPSTHLRQRKPPRG